MANQVEVIEQLVTTNHAAIDHAMTTNASSDDWKRISDNIEEQLKIVRTLKINQDEQSHQRTLADRAY